MDYIISTQYMTHTGHRWKFDFGAVYRVKGGDTKANVVAKTLRYINARLGSAEIEYPVHIMTDEEFFERFGNLSTEFHIVLDYEKDLA
jgi:hypothetical protein